jgi:hypothetical protein
MSAYSSFPGGTVVTAAWIIVGFGGIAVGVVAIDYFADWLSEKGQSAGRFVQARRLGK